MIRLVFLAFVISFTYANDNIINPKKCEVIKLSNFTTLVSCHKLDYLVEYYIPRLDEEDTIKKITVLTKEDKKIIIKKNTGR